jgi:hypothetical protein
MSGPGRNDPCPCGSGKKHKKCCLASAGAAAPPSPVLVQRLRQVEGRLMDALLEHADRHYGETKAHDYPPKRIAEHYAKQRGTRLDALERRFIEEACRARHVDGWRVDHVRLRAAADPAAIPARHRRLA